MDKKIYYFHNQLVSAVLFCMCISVTKAQVVNTAIVDSTLGERIGNITVGGYLDIYGGVSRVNDTKMTYMTSSSNLEELNINLAAIYLQFQTERFRSRIIPGYGTYMENNYAIGDARLVEASAGFKLSNSKEVWIDAGILGSPFTNESAFSKDHLMYTRSLAPEYVPYFISGVKLSLPLSEKWFLYAYVINGWQQINDKVKGPAMALQVEYKPTQTLLFNGNLFVGNESMTQEGKTGLRAFADFYMIYKGTGRWSATSCVYYGLQNATTNGSKEQHYWGQVNAIADYKITPKFSLSGRLEYFNDPANVMIKYLYGLPGYETASGGLCFNLKVRNNALLRLDTRFFYSFTESYLSNYSKNWAPWVCLGLTVWY